MVIVHMAIIVSERERVLLRLNLGPPSGLLEGTLDGFQKLLVAALGSRN